MLNQLKIVNKAVSKNPTHPIMSHLHINDGQVTAMNGAITIVAEVPGLTGLHAIVPADKFLKAIATTHPAEASITTTDKNIIVKSGSFRAQMPLSPDAFPEVDMTGTPEVIAGDFIEGLAIASRYMGDKFPGVLLREGHLYATDNTAMVQVAVSGLDNSNITLPEEAVNVLTSIGQVPTGMRIADNYAVFIYDTFKVQCLLLDLRWPDVTRYTSDFDAETLPPIPNGLKEAVETVAKFIGKNAPFITFENGTVSGGDASVSNINVPDAKMQAETLRRLLSVMTKADFTTNPYRFAGDGVVGVCAGAV